MITIQHENGLVGLFAEFELADHKRFGEEVIEQLRAKGIRAAKSRAHLLH